MSLRQSHHPIVSTNLLYPWWKNWTRWVMETYTNKTQLSKSHFILMILLSSNNRKCLMSKSIFSLFPIIFALDLRMNLHQATVYNSLKNTFALLWSTLWQIRLKLSDFTSNLSSSICISGIFVWCAIDKFGTCGRLILCTC